MRLTRLLPLGLIVLLAGCGETAEAIHDTADIVTGNQAVQMKDPLTHQIREIERAHEERLREALPPK